MALRNLDFDVSVNGIVPNTITDAGTQGDHGVTRLNFMISGEIYQKMNEAAAFGRVMYRFDVYDGEGGVWQSAPVALKNQYADLVLEEKHTRFGGKLVVYLVITAISMINTTEIELYNFPVILRLKNRPNGTQQIGENYESVASLVNDVRQRETSVTMLAKDVEEKLKNGEFDGVGVLNTEILNDELIITYTNGISQNLGRVKGDKGDAGKDAVIDQTFDSGSENAQSGKAIANELNGYTKAYPHDVEAVYSIGVQSNKGDAYLITDFSDERIHEIPIVRMKNRIPLRRENGNLVSGTPQHDIEVVNKKYIDDNYYTKTDINSLDCVKYVTMYDSGESIAASISSPTENQYIDIHDNADMDICAGDHNININGAKIISVGKPENSSDAVNKAYVDDLVGDIETLLGGI